MMNCHNFMEKDCFDDLFEMQKKEEGKFWVVVNPGSSAAFDKFARDNNIKAWKVGSYMEARNSGYDIRDIPDVRGVFFLLNTR